MCVYLLCFLAITTITTSCWIFDQSIVGSVNFLERFSHVNVTKMKGKIVNLNKFQGNRQQTYSVRKNTIICVVRVTQKIDAG